MALTEIFVIVLLFLFIAFAFILIFTVFIYYLIFHLFAILSRGAIFAKSTDKIIERMISLSCVKPGEKAVDLGSGDGRLVVVLAKAGAEAHGYEINPFLVWLSRKNIKNLGLQNRAFIHRENFWNKDLSEFSTVTVYGIGYMMKKLEKKLGKELKPGSKVVSNYFIFPNWPHSKKENSIRLYIK